MSGEIPAGQGTPDGVLPDKPEPAHRKRAVQAVRALRARLDALLVTLGEQGGA